MGSVKGKVCCGAGGRWQCQHESGRWEGGAGEGKHTDVTGVRIQGATCQMTFSVLSHVPVFGGQVHALNSARLLLGLASMSCNREPSTCAAYVALFGTAVLYTVSLLLSPQVFPLRGLFGSA